MDNQPENKSIQLDTDYENHAINMKFSNNLTDDRERGYILSAAFFILRFTRSRQTRSY